MMFTRETRTNAWLHFHQSDNRWRDFLGGGDDNPQMGEPCWLLIFGSL